MKPTTALSYKPTPSGQRGAALIVGLIMLVVLSMMAIASMNTATLDLMMAGNDQYRERAFQAAEMGIEVSLTVGQFNTNLDDIPLLASNVGNGNDTFLYAITRPFGSSIRTAPGQTSKSFGAAYFDVQSVGTSERSGTATNNQQLFIIVNQPPEYGPGEGCGTTSLTGASTC